MQQNGCDEYLYNGTELDQYKQCGVIPNSIGTSYWEYSYDNRGNLTGSNKYTRTTEGMKMLNVAAYVYDETNRLVSGKNEQGEYSLYTYNGLGVRVGRELIMQDNTHGYTDFHDLTPSVSTDLDKPEVVKESYVVDYTTATRETLTMHEEGGFDYRWVYGLDRLSVKVTSEGTNWWGQNVKQDILKDYAHQDRMGSTTNLTDQFGRVVGRADYNEWGELTYKEELNITSAYRRIYPQASYTGHDWDDVLGMYYAKARFYDPAAKRFVAMDPVKGNVVDPLSLVPYIYCVDNPMKYVDPLGLSPLPSMLMGVGPILPVIPNLSLKIGLGVDTGKNDNTRQTLEPANSFMATPEGQKVVEAVKEDYLQKWRLTNELSKWTNSAQGQAIGKIIKGTVKVIAGAALEVGGAALDVIGFTSLTGGAALAPVTGGGTAVVGGAIAAAAEAAGSLAMVAGANLMGDGVGDIGEGFDKLECNSKKEADKKPTSPNQMQTQVRKGQAPREVESVHNPDSIYSEPHVHFSDGTSITQSGKIHDKGHGMPNLTNEILEWLHENGWCLNIK